VNKMPTIKEFIERLEKHYKEDDFICAPIWVVSDAKDYASSQMDIEEELSDEFCEGVLDSMDDSHDASLGINWDVMEIHINCQLEDDENDKFAKIPKEDLPKYVSHEFRFVSTRRIFETRLQGKRIGE